MSTGFAADVGHLDELGSAVGRVVHPLGDDDLARHCGDGRAGESEGDGSGGRERHEDREGPDPLVAHGLRVQ